MVNSTNKTNSTAKVLRFHWSWDHYSWWAEILLVIYCISFSVLLLNRLKRTYKVYKAMKKEKGD